jgi:uncharacterized protein YunC (DUF1805 family)
MTKTRFECGTALNMHILIVDGNETYISCGRLNDEAIIS